MSQEIRHGDCLDVMAGMDTESVTAIATDPPYGFQFMGKQWDHGVPGKPFWEAALRVAIPGAPLLAFGGTRTFHRLACAIEDAGWQIADTLCWLYGSGFPKGLNISKAIDKERREDEEPVRKVCRFVRAAMEKQGITSSSLAPAFGMHSRMIDHWAARDTDSQPSLPTEKQYLQLKDELSLGPEMDGEVARLNRRKGLKGDAWRSAQVLGEDSRDLPGLPGMRFESEDAFIRKPSERASLWDGWRSQVKPAWEPIILAVKPMPGSYASNALEHGVAGLNIGGCRIPTDERVSRPATDNSSAFGLVNDDAWKPRPIDYKMPNAGRYPANVVLDEEAAQMLDAQTGVLTSGDAPRGLTRNSDKHRNAYSAFAGRRNEGNPCLGDSGGPSRFFYCAKASASERGEFNDHPTVKPLALMTWLCKLVSMPERNLILDPFAGSGSTIVACAKLGLPAIGIEKEAESAQIAQRRLEEATRQGSLFAEKPSRGKDGESA